MFKGLGRFGGMGAMTAGAFAAAVLALGAWIGSKRAGPEDAPQTAVAVVPERDATPENATLAPNAVQGVSLGPKGEAATEPQPDAPVETAEQPAAPAFDEVRRESDGMTVIAGRATPGSTVSVLKDGKEVASATADGAGKFATLAIIPPSETGHVLTLLEQDGDTKIASEEEIILTPSAPKNAPIEMAEANPAPEENPVDLIENDAEQVAGEIDRQSVAAEVATEDTAEAQVKSETSDAMPRAGTEVDMAEAAVPQNSDAEAMAATDGNAAPVGSIFDQATPLAGTATAGPEDTDAQTQTPATTATPLAGTGTAGAEAELPKAQGSATGVSGQTDRATATAQATPLAGTGTAEADETAPLKQGREEGEAGEAGRTPAQAQATPLAGIGAAEGESTAPSEPDSAAEMVDQPAVASAEVTPSAETGTAEENDAAEAAPNATPEPSSVAENTIPQPAEPTPTPAPVLKSTAEGVERLDTAPPQVMTNVALDTIGYSDEGDVQLAGRAQPDTREVRVYLNNNAVINLPVDQEGRWRGDLPNVDEGVYTLRVDELSRAGDVTSRVETPFKRESPEVLAAATEGLTGPLSAVTVQKGDTLWAISRDRYGDPLLYVKVFEANSGNIRDPDLIYPGQVFDLPEEPASE
ncbi:LysM peptidoglycan-binding domain-containing protein [Sulfitobacter dubius]|uniref:LysM peptidoglycan-binding domain-containing protein n=1 Tax=Sulfitobacter dubius TaxID=218673 RepID=UPI0008F1817C|nr:LysM peptidoglycan-binding domain-containing protein [Sulfitobacter dubius]SFG22998.1 LysM domain-containing protein [Sulfitobacter dubius]